MPKGERNNETASEYDAVNGMSSFLNGQTRGQI